MTKKTKKRKYEVSENETITDCLERMKKDGYMPVRRVEEPIFKEEIINGKKEIIPCGKKTIFEGKLT
ncbi:NETI motif-containing protein [Bacillus alveayuensis]|jgi:hypothetical protein|uniref:NETI motif-containing protein n=1 Tax=Aeribacillus alveayuensis TaxID=279215 RepID=UPI0005D0EE9C|nr:NETI motif-containing protein [Bacillus alveayuensis]